MQVYYSFDEVVYSPATALTIGTFDGVHRGHRHVLSMLKETAASDGLRSLVITFDPHPQIILGKPDRPPIRLLTNIGERLALFEEFGIDDVLVVPFSYEFSQLPPDEFVRDWLHGRVGMKKMMIGYDHSFGKNREGNSSLLDGLSATLGFGIERIEPFSDAGMVISSTKIRHALEERNLALANEMLGYEYFVSGKVVHGRGVGSDIGFPTANVKPPDKYKLMPGNGVYLVSSEMEGEKIFGMANIGTRPTLTSDTAPTLEVNFFEFDEDLYEKSIKVNFTRYIRAEKKFSGADELIRQINVDKIKCLEIIDNF